MNEEKQRDCILASGIALPVFSRFFSLKNNCKNFQKNLRLSKTATPICYNTEKKEMTMKKGLFSMNNAQLRYALVVAGIMFLLALLVWLNLIDDSIVTFITVCICVIILLTLIGALFLLKGNNGLILHIAVACTTSINIYLSMGLLSLSHEDADVYVSMIIITCLLFFFYVGEFFVLKRERRTPDNDRFYLFGVALFTVIGILIDLFFWQPEWAYLDELALRATVMMPRMKPSIFGAFFILIPLIYLPFYLTKNIKPAVSYTAMGIAVLLTFIDIGITFFSYSDLEPFFGNLIGNLILVIGIFTAYIVYDRIIHSKKNKTEGNPATSAKTVALSFDEKVEQLQKLQTLREAGILTEEEFSAQKQKIVGGK